MDAFSGMRMDDSSERLLRVLAMWSTDVIVADGSHACATTDFIFDSFGELLKNGR